MQSGILIFVVVLVVGLFACAVIVGYFRQRTAGNAPKLPLTEIARAAFASSDPSTRSPAGSMAARREDIEEMLRGKEDLHSE